ncbi:SpoIID/LytB domain-containing protein [Paenibacillus sp. JX-17]|uniref:SpoIID/LytB domain-containing protein n=1 Tax=Paenibacillus lacisoli TaxID=3064525 RepID=A0ABT9CHM4_9BACL|nr:SpoIID/LytB domain-containing protein [Paenibacillus sp. JX-17]MDO7908078.1 SpoIID/LytB domain-containing protein [Paenibacillus sp. JX-17]
MKLSRRWRKRIGMTAAASVLAAAMLMPMAAPADAEGTASTIRVAMFADLGSKYKSTTPYVTMSSGGSWSLGQQGTSGFQSWVDLPSDKQVRFSIDSYKVKVLETADFKTAAAAAKALQAGSDKPFLFSASKNGAAVYQLYAGPYTSEALANTAAARTAKTVSAQLNGQQPAAVGSYHLTAGVFANQTAANSVKSQLNNAGFDADTVIVNSSGKASYEVWTGEALNTAGLSSLKSAIAARLPQLPLNTVSSTAVGAIIRTDAGLNLTTLQTSPHYLLSIPANAKMTIHGGDEGIQLVERSKRTYRGDLELSILSGQLAVVNELPIEQYLYSVVGAEVYSSWPAESLKAQAVAARSYALAQGMKFTIANVVDTTLSQAYNGMSSENAAVSKAVDATEGEVLINNGKVVEAVFSSNAGGVTADTSEVWNGGGNVFKSVDSSSDIAAAKDQKSWYHVLLKSGKTGYIREDNVKELEGVTEAGLGKVTVTAQNTNVRPLPLIQSGVNPVAQLSPGEEAIVLEEVTESGSYAWIRGPYTGAEILKFMQGKTTGSLPSSINQLEVTQRGPSGRVTMIQVNGQNAAVKTPDTYRSAMGSVPSTLFEITGTGSYTVLGADGTRGTMSAGQSSSVLSASGKTSVANAGTVIMDGSGDARVVDSSQKYLITGYGNGHGLGLSQWGAKGLADQGYDYQAILKHYYQNVTITKE